MSQTNVLMEDWSGPYGGVPPWDHVKAAHFTEALESSLVERHSAVVRIARNPEPPTFENTIEALERAGRTCDRILPVFNVMRLNMSNADYRALDREWQPKLAAANDAILFMPRLFDGSRPRIACPARLGRAGTARPQVWDEFVDLARASRRWPRAAFGHQPDWRLYADFRAVCWPTRTRGRC